MVTIVRAASSRPGVVLASLTAAGNEHNRLRSLTVAVMRCDDKN